MTAGYLSTGAAVGNVLITVTGRDRAGVSAALFDVLTPHADAVVDIEQVVIHGRLTLGVLVRTTDEQPLRESLSNLASRLDIDIDVTGQDDSGQETPNPVSPGLSSPLAPAERTVRHYVTVLGHPLPPAALSAVVHRIAAADANIDRIVRLAAYPITAFELLVSGGSHDELTASLAQVAVEESVDIAVQPAALHRRAKRLIVLDVDSTLIQGEVIEMLAAAAGPHVAAEVADITASAMAGNLDFEKSLRARVGLLAGLAESVLAEVGDAITLQPGAKTLIRTLKRLGYQVGIVSGGFTQVTDRLVKQLGLDYGAANTLEIRDGALTGALVGTIVDRAGKARALEQFAAAVGVPLSQTVAVGDGANDLDMLERAGFGIAFNAKPIVRAAADTAVSLPYLDAILFFLGISRDDVESADAQDGDGPE